MKRLFQLFFALLFFGGVFSSVALAQDGDCCDEYDPAVQQEIDALNKQKAALLGSLSLINSDIEKLRKQSADLDKQLLLVYIFFADEAQLFLD